MTNREQHAIRLIQSALASMEMRSERGFDLRVPRVWVEAAHDLCYGQEADQVMASRIDSARNRMIGPKLAYAVEMLQREHP